MVDDLNDVRMPGEAERFRFTAETVGGQTVASLTVVGSGTTITVDATDTASVDSATTLAANYGCLVYDDTIAGKNGICYNYFGGAQQVTSGSYTIVWNASGIAAVSVA